MTISQEVLDYGLLSELAYLKLESEFFLDLPEATRWSTQNIENFFDDATYDGNTGVAPSRQEAMLTLLQTYTIKEFTTDPSSGMQAMVLEGNGKQVIAFRGTEPDSLNDIYNDKVLALDGVKTDQMISAEAWMDTLKSEGKISTDPIVVGHSLGGALAQLIGYENAYETHTFNGFGIQKNTASFIAGDDSRIYNYHLGADFVSGLGSDIGGIGGALIIPFGFATAILANYTLSGLYGSFLGNTYNFAAYNGTDWSSAGTDHLMKNFNETLDIYENYLVELFRTTDINEITNKIASLSGLSNQTTSSPVGMPRIIEYTARAIGVNNVFDYTNLTTVQSIFQNALSYSNGNGFIDLTSFSEGELVSAAKDSNAILYAAINNTFITLNNDSYVLYESLDDKYSDMQKEDRGRYLYFSIKPGSSNSATGTVYQDKDYGVAVFDKMGAINTVVFGSNENVAETLSGLSGDDRLYGNTGDDTIAGNAGDDYIEGGKGKDKLFGGKGGATYRLFTTG